MPNPIFYKISFSGVVGQIDDIVVTDVNQNVYHPLGGHAPVILPSNPPGFNPITDMPSLMADCIDMINDVGVMSNFLPNQSGPDWFNLYDGSGVQFNGATVVVTTSNGVTCLNPSGTMTPSNNSYNISGSIIETVILSGIAADAKAIARALGPHPMQAPGISRVRATILRTTTRLLRNK